MERLELVQRAFGLCAAKTGTKMDESMQAGENWYESVRKDVQTNLNTCRGKGSCQEGERMEQ